MNEFDLIYKLINQQSISRQDVSHGIGDDCAIVSVRPGHQLAVSMDTLVSGVHFPAETDPFSIGYKSLAVNLSDLAASGADPAWVTLSLTLPESDQKWLTEFMRGFYQLADKYNVQLIGGDTTKGPLSITVQAHGFVEQPLLRSGASAGQLVCVSGTLGDAALGLKQFTEKASVPSFCVEKLTRPEPRIKLSAGIRHYVTSMIDISDGLMADLGHICQQSNCGAEIFLMDIPLSDDYRLFYKDIINYNEVTCFGDDYELCFTIEENSLPNVIAVAKEQGVKVTCIGKLVNTKGINLIDASGHIVSVTKKGFDHFS